MSKEEERFTAFREKIGALFASGEMDGADAAEAIEEYIADHAEAYPHDADERYSEFYGGAI